MRETHGSWNLVHFVLCINVECTSSLVHRYLVSLGCIKPLCDLLTVMDSKIVQVALNGLENILRLGEQEGKRSGSGVNPYCGLIEEAYGRFSPDLTYVCWWGRCWNTSSVL